ncbi:cell division septum initiation protein DivIVA [Lachnospiraceae bacterium PF1-21]|uniref:Uncharacterized protein n=1 Tax=Ohessyouella blattaphilus TaxID=2949333 RepID=A0ABT1ELG7_9FIRM|nr:hypothetical protein [Ohessyouella blattaphilus]MCP1111530.1 hypothetical protein [Ohessyouella blattaphilus]MCR8564924.1 hypothetical protein [Ohessyouella blattaphilus]
MQFEEARRGYQKEPVDEYIKALSEEYKNLLEELEAEKVLNNELQQKNEALKASQTEWEQKARTLSKKVETLQREKRNLEMEKPPLPEDTSYSEAIASALVSAELSAKQIVERAREEAKLIREAAVLDLEELEKAKQKTISSIRTISSDLLNVLREEEKMRVRSSLAERIQDGHKEEGGDR